MPLEKLQCENCGGPLQIDPNGKNVVCLYCGTPYIKKDNHFVINQITIVDEHASHSRIKAGNDNLRIKRFNQAMHDFSAACELAPGDHRVWWGMIRAYTHDFSKKDFTTSQFEILKDYYDKMTYFLPVDLRPEYYRQFTSYYEPLYRAHIDEKNRLTQTIESINSQIISAERKRRELEQSRFDLLEPFSKGVSSFLWGCIGWGFVILVAVFFIDGLNDGIIPIIGIALFATPIVLFLLYYVIIRPIPNMIVRSCRKRNHQKLDALRIDLNDLYQKKGEATNRLTHICR